MTGSWLVGDEDTPFPIENLPIGVFSRQEERRIGVALGTFVVDVGVLASAGLLDGLGYSARSVLSKHTLNEYMSLPRSAWRATRARLQSLLGLSERISAAVSTLRDDAKLRASAIIPMSKCKMHLPAEIGDYTDFYSSREHATNVGIMFRGAANALQPNWLHLPVGYHGRSSSVVISDTDVVRPSGQLQIDRDDPSKGSSYGTCKLLDFELEMAFFLGGPPNDLGRPVTMAEAEDRIFGVVLMNDWSARDIQAWEYVPLGPFTAKNFCTTISPWIVSLDALEPFRCSSSAGPVQSEPTPLPYLQDPSYASSSYNVDLEVTLQGSCDAQPSVISRSNLKYLYWNFKQQLVHHAVSGCPMRPGDLLGTGTISGPTADPPTLGSMLELSWRGARDIVLESSAEPNNVRKFLKDGDVVNMTGTAVHKDLGYRIGFGDCRGKVFSAPAATGLPPAPPSEKSSGSQYVGLRLYSYWRSSCSYRVRIALGLKGLAYEYVPVDISILVGNTTATLPASYTGEVNPMEQVPTLECTDTATGKVVRITQSLAIIEFLEEAFPTLASLFPGTLEQRARSREIAEICNSGIQPLQNLAFLRQVKTAVLVGGDGTEVDSRAYATSAIAKGLAALEQLVASSVSSTSSSGPFAAGTSAPSVADACLVPQLYNARRFNIDVATAYPTLVAVVTRLEKMDAVAAAAPEKMSDAVAM